MNNDNKLIAQNYRKSEMTPKYYQTDTYKYPMQETTVHILDKDLKRYISKFYTRKSLTTEINMNCGNFQVSSRKIMFAGKLVT